LRRPSRQRQPEKPHWLGKRPTTSTGIAIPWMHTEEKEDEEEMNILSFMNPDKVATAIHFRRCGICGIKISPMDKCHFLTTTTQVHQCFVTPPMHDSCVEYYLQNHDQLHHDLEIVAVDDLHTNFKIGATSRFHCEWEDDIEGFVVYTNKAHTTFKGTNAVNYRQHQLIIDIDSEE